MRCRYIKFLFLFLCLCGFHNESFSQIRIHSDKINFILNQDIADSLKQKEIFSIFSPQLKTNWTNAIEIAEHATIYFKNNNPEYLVFWYTELGKIFLDQGLYLSSLVSLRDALEICRKNNFNDGTVMLYFAKNFYMQEKYEQSIIYYNNALNQFEKLKITDKKNALKGIAKTYNKLGIVYELKNDFVTSEMYYKKALHLRIKIDDIHGIIDSYTSLGYFYNVLKKYDTAIDYFNKGLKICIKHDSFHQYYNDLHLFRSTSYLEQEKIKKSYLDIDSAKIHALKNRKYDLSRVYFYYAKTDYAAKKYEKLRAHLQKSLQYADTFNLVSMKLEALGLYINADVRQNNYNNAFLLLTEKNKITKRIFSEKLYNVEKSFELENKKRKISELEFSSEKLKERNKVYVTLTLLSLFSVLLLIGLIISDRKKNKKLSERKKYLETLFTHSPFGIVITDSSGKIKDVNKKLLDILGSPSESKTLKLGNINKIHNLKEIGFDNDLEKVNLTGQISDKEYRYVSYWNKETVLRVLNVPLKNKKGDVYSVYSIIEDISNRIKNEQTIRKLSEMVKQSTVSIITTDKNGVIDYVNPYFTKVTGYTEEDALGKKTDILKSGLTPKETFKDLWKTLKQNKTWRGEFINKTKSGKTYWESAIIFPLKNDKNEVVNYIGFLEDISEKKNLQELLEKKELKLKELNETKDKFFSIIAHDLKNPFGAILSLSDLLYTNYNEYDDRKKKDIIRIISEGAKNTYDLLENLLTWSRSQKGDINFSPGKLLLNKLISDNIKLLSDMALKKNISVSFEADEEIEIYADFNMLNFVIRNLLTNALKFTPQQGEIEFVIENKKKQVIFCIKDTGIGMNAEQLNGLFKVDQTYSGKGTENETGTGLGLILCKDFIDFHKGKIRVQSELGKGSTFCVELPK